VLLKPQTLGHYNSGFSENAIKVVNTDQYYSTFMKALLKLILYNSTFIKIAIVGKYNKRNLQSLGVEHLTPRLFITVIKTKTPDQKEKIDQSSFSCFPSFLYSPSRQSSIFVLRSIVSPKNLTIKP
jgi:hypothetical protein